MFKTVSSKPSVDLITGLAEKKKSVGYLYLCAHSVEGEGVIPKRIPPLPHCLLIQNQNASRIRMHHAA